MDFDELVADRQVFPISKTDFEDYVWVCSFIHSLPACMSKYDEKVTSTIIILG